jgi:hypothetical protein
MTWKIGGAHVCPSIHNDFNLHYIELLHAFWTHQLAIHTLFPTCLQEGIPAHGKTLAEINDSLHVELAAGSFTKAVVQQDVPAREKMHDMGKQQQCNLRGKTVGCLVVKCLGYMIDSESIVIILLLVK